MEIKFKSNENQMVLLIITVKIHLPQLKLSIFKEVKMWPYFFLNDF